MLAFMWSIQEYVVQGGQAITAGEVDSFRRQLAAYKLKAEILDTSKQPLLREQASFLLRYIEDVLDDIYPSSDFAALPESIFAIRYLAKSVDVIPDNVPEGFTDDAAVLQAVLTGHESEFRNYCEKQKLDFDAISPVK